MVIPLGGSTVTIRCEATVTPTSFTWKDSSDTQITTGITTTGATTELIVGPITNGTLYKCDADIDSSTQTAEYTTIVLSMCRHKRYLS